jgi:hypothetical protein
MFKTDEGKFDYWLAVKILLLGGFIYLLYKDKKEKENQNG